MEVRLPKEALKGKEWEYLEYYEHNVYILAIEVVGQYWSSKGWVGRMALSCHVSKDLGCQETTDAFRRSSSRKGGGGVPMPKFFLSM